MVACTIYLLNILGKYVEWNAQQLNIMHVNTVTL